MPPLPSPYHDEPRCILEAHTMAENVLLVLLFVTALGSGIMAGVFFAFSTSVVAALAKIHPAQGIAAMQAINLAVVNPLFLLALFGTALACVFLIAAALLGWGDLSTGWVIAGSVLYLIGGIVATIVGNIPRNNTLAALDPDTLAGAAYLTRYLSEWTVWNHVRTGGCVAALACFILALR